MGREIRQVPPGWEHPKDARGEYIPLLDGDYETAAEAWVNNCVLWSRGEHPDQIDGSGVKYRFFWEWADTPPRKEEYRPRWAADEATHFQIYETVSEGTPTSPVFETRAELARWLVGQGHSAAAAGAFAVSGYAPSMVMTGGRLYMGIDAAAVLQEGEPK